MQEERGTDHLVRGGDERTRVLEGQGKYRCAEDGGDKPLCRRGVEVRTTVQEGGGGMYHCAGKGGGRCGMLIQ